MTLVKFCIIKVYFDRSGLIWGESVFIKGISIDIFQISFYSLWYKRTLYAYIFA